jgi:hypothetical protein
LEEEELAKRKALEEAEKERCVLKTLKLILDLFRLRREKERLEELERQRLEAERQRLEDLEKQRIERERIER